MFCGVSFMERFQSIPDSLLFMLAQTMSNMTPLPVLFMVSEPSVKLYWLQHPMLQYALALYYQEAAAHILHKKYLRSTESS
jgi:hypothetical protein